MPYHEDDDPIAPPKPVADPGQSTAAPETAAGEPAAVDTGSPSPNSAGWLEYVRVMRIDHWLKNVFILFGHAVAIALLQIEISFSLILVILFSLLPACLVASANYILNEILDAPFDRMHPTKKHRAVAAGTVNMPVLWGVMALLLIIGFGLSLAFFNIGYTISLLLLALSGLVYNVQPIRLKDRAFLDVIAESFNNPIRLWLGWYAISPWDSFPPLSLVLAWWFFGALLMTGKRYAEFRFINDAALSGKYRKSFQVYTNKSLVVSMITYANLFCFCMGAAITHYKPNLIFVFPVILVAIITYFNFAMTERGARLEPEQLMKNPKIIAATLATILLGLILVWLPQDLPERLRFFELISGRAEPAPTVTPEP